MKTSALLALAIITLFSSPGFAQEQTTESCAQIRGKIAAQTGDLAKPDTELLKKIGARSDCAFTTPEAYRAAFGDRAPAPYEPRREREHHDDNDDD
jgi:hypothetical protein